MEKEKNIWVFICFISTVITCMYLCVCTKTQKIWEFEFEACYGGLFLVLLHFPFEQELISILLSSLRSSRSCLTVLT